MLRRQHSGRPQAESLVRPLLRRLATIDRPARVRIRRRKPWVFARRRVLGWNVRLLTLGSPYLLRSRGRPCHPRHPQSWGWPGGSAVIGNPRHPRSWACENGRQADDYGTRVGAHRANLPAPREAESTTMARHPASGGATRRSDGESLPEKSTDLCGTGCPWPPRLLASHLTATATHVHPQVWKSVWKIDEHAGQEHSRGTWTHIHRGDAATETSGVRAWRMPT